MIPEIDNTTKSYLKEISVRDVKLMKEPCDNKVGQRFWRFAYLVEETRQGPKFLFLNSRKVYDYQNVANVQGDRNNRLMCEFINGTTHNTVESCKLSDLCECAEFADREILLKGLENKKLKNRMAKYQAMHNAIMPLKNKDKVSVEELLRYERLLVCVQERDINKETSEKTLSDFCL